MVKTAPYESFGCHLYYVFTYIYSLLIEKDICDRQNVSIKLPCVYVCLSSRDLFIFSVRVSSLFFLFLKFIGCLDSASGLLGTVKSHFLPCCISNQNASMQYYFITVCHHCLKSNVSVLLMFAGYCTKSFVLNALIIPTN